VCETLVNHLGLFESERSRFCACQVATKVIVCILVLLNGKLARISLFSEASESNNVRCPKFVRRNHVTRTSSANL
jgi:hypothetical protein